MKGINLKKLGELIENDVLKDTLISIFTFDQLPHDDIPDRLEYIFLKEYLFENLYNWLIHKKESNGHFRITPVIEEIKHFTKDTLDVKISLYENFPLDSSFSLYVEDKKLESNVLPIHYSGELKNVKIVFTNPYTKEEKIIRGQ